MKDEIGIVARSKRTNGDCLVVVSRARLEKALASLDQLPILTRVYSKSYGRFGVIIRGQLQRVYADAMRFSKDVTEVTVVDETGEGHTCRSDAHLAEVGWVVVPQ